jgi:WD40 repeat protein
MEEAGIIPTTESTNNTPQFVTSQLTGHRKAVTCMVMHPTDNECLVSGSDDKTVRLWDIRTNRSNQCIGGGCFTEAIESLAFVDENFLCVASGKTLLSFDIRFEGVLLRTPLSVLDEGFEDINKIVPHPYTKERTLAVADDSGTITLIPLTPQGLLRDTSAVSTHFKKLARVHTNIVGAVAFKPTNKNELISGGYDCAVCVWDISRGKPSASVRVEHIVNEGDEGGSFFVFLCVFFSTKAKSWTHFVLPVQCILFYNYIDTHFCCFCCFSQESSPQPSLRAGDRVLLRWSRGHAQSGRWNGEYLHCQM